MAINAEKLYELSKDALLRACMMEFPDEKDGRDLYNNVTKPGADGRVWATAVPNIGSALEIFSMAREEVLKTKGGSVYSAVKRIVKSACSMPRSALHGAWVDSEGRQCFCDGYHAVRLKNHVDGFEAVLGMDLDMAFPSDKNTYLYDKELTLPTPGELKVSARPLKGGRKTRKGYNFGDGLPLVDADFLKNIMDCLPGCKAYTRSDNPETTMIYFLSDAGDAVLCPVRKTA